MTATAPEPDLALVVEDEPLILMETADLIQDAGYAVLEAHNAEQALALIRQRSAIVLMVTDVNMPGRMKGFELARMVQAAYPQIAIIVCSGQLSPAAGDLPAKATFLRKPLSAKILAPVLRRQPSIDRG